MGDYGLSVIRAHRGSASLRHSRLVPSASFSRARGITAPNEPNNWRAYTGE
jgi:hypothetical protein